MVVQEKARGKTVVKSTEKSNVNDIVRTITDMLWSYDSVKHVVKNNYVILNAIVRNAIKSLNINADNFDIESFYDNFDIHMLDLKSQDTLGYSLSELLSRFIVNKADNNVEKAMEMAPAMIESRLKEIIDYLRKNPNDSESLEYAKDLINQLREFNRDLARKYESELSTILNPKPRVVEPKPVVKVIESKPVEPRTNVVKHNVDNERAKEIENIEYFLKMYIAYIRLPPSQSTPYYIEKAKELIDRLRKLNPQLALKYERILNTVLYEKRKYANYGKKEPRAKVRIRHASVRITEYLNVNETENDKRELVNDVNAVDAVDVSEILRPKPTKPRSVKTNTKTEKQKPRLLRRLRQIMDVIGKDFVNMYYYHYYRRRY